MTCFFLFLLERKNMRLRFPGVTKMNQQFKNVIFYKLNSFYNYLYTTQIQICYLSRNLNLNLSIRKIA